jgi:glutathione synthase/RimK-type ligase-like ATP-grasp enzyme
MLLIITNKDDYTADYLINKLNQQNRKYYRLNTEDIFDLCKVSFKIIEHTLKTVFPFSDEIEAVWFRRVKFPVLNDMLSTKEKEYMYNEIDAFFKNLWETIDAKWLSIPHFTYRAESKLLQLKKAGQLEFNLPKSLISSDAEEISNFYYELNKNVIIKPLYNNRYRGDALDWLIYTNKLTDEKLESLSKAAPLHSIYQECIQKKLELRVTVVGNEVFAASVDSQNHSATKTDWRRKKLKFKSFELPEMIKTKCIKLVKDLNISFGAIDIILTPEDKYIFLEINPNGQWAWIEFDTEQKISQSIIEYLYGR